MNLHAASIEIQRVRAGGSTPGSEYGNESRNDKKDDEACRPHLECEECES